jgi:hypothetical protein
MNATIMKAKFASKSKGLQFVHDLVWFSPTSQIVWTPTSSHFVSRYTSATDVQCRFSTQDDLPACEPTSDTVGDSSRPSGSLDHTGDPSRQALPFSGPSSHVSNGNDSASVSRQPRKRTGEESRDSTKRTRNSVQRPGAVAPHGSSNTNTNTNIIARQLQELEPAMMGASREHRASSTLSYPSRAPNFAGPSSSARSSTVCRSPSPGALSRRRNRIAGSDTSMLFTSVRVASVVEAVFGIYVVHAFDEFLTCRRRAVRVR